MEWRGTLETSRRSEGRTPVSAAKRSLLLLAVQWIAVAGCARTTAPQYWDYHPPLKPQLIPCGQPLPAKCQHQRLSFSELPSRTPAGSLGEWSFDTGSGEGLSEQARLSGLRAYHGDKFPDSTFGLERVARGFYGDSLETRQIAEGKLAKRLWRHGDDGGAVDLTYLLVRDGRSGGFSDSGWLVTLVRRCLSTKMLHTLTLAPEEELLPYFDITPEHRGELALLNLLKARGLVELGEYDEARVLFEDYTPRAPYVPNFVPQCTKWLEGRAEELTPVPVGRPCNCEIEPPKWREGCGCPPASDAVEPPAPPSPDSNRPVCDPGQREVPGGVIAVDEPCREQ